MNHRIYYTLKKKWNIIKEITAAIEVPNINGLRLLLIFLNGGMKYEKESLP